MRLCVVVWGLVLRFEAVHKRVRFKGLRIVGFRIRVRTVQGTCVYHSIIILILILSSLNQWYWPSNTHITVERCRV